MCHNFDNSGQSPRSGERSECQTKKQDTIFKNCEHNWFQIEKKTYLKKLTRHKCKKEYLRTVGTKI